MKRFHVHIAVENLAQNIAFYSQLFGQPPAKQHEDYAKWMIDDPRVNFAISTKGVGKGTGTGLDHFGMQVESDSELAAIKMQARAASNDGLFGEGETTCCYANSDKHWVSDPQGLPWEHFKTMSDAQVYRDSSSECCVPVDSAAQDISVQDKGSCCA